MWNLEQGYRCKSSNPNLRWAAESHLPHYDSSEHHGSGYLLVEGGVLDDCPSILVFQKVVLI